MSLVGFSCSTCSARVAKPTVTHGVNSIRAAWLTWQVPPLEVCVHLLGQRSTAQSSPLSLNGDFTAPRDMMKQDHQGVNAGEPLLRESPWRTWLQINSRLWCDTYRTPESARSAWIVRLRLPSAPAAMWFVVWSVHPCVKSAHYVEVRLLMLNESSFLVSKNGTMYWSGSKWSSWHLHDHAVDDLIQWPQWGWHHQLHYSSLVLCTKFKSTTECQ